MRYRGWLALAVIGALTVAGGCSQTPQSTAAAGEAGRIAAFNQPAEGVVRVDEIGMPSTGWVVVHAVRGGAPDLTGSLGHAYVPAGPSRDVRVVLDTPVPPGSEVAVMLHLDTGVAQVFEFANGSVEPQDLPVLRDGAPVMARIMLN